MSASQHLKFNDSFTLFLYSFKYSGNLIELIESVDSKWERSSISPDQSSFFNHVYEFFTSAQTDPEINDSSQLIIYRIKSDNLNEMERENVFLYNVLFSKRHTVETAEKEIPFKFLKGNNILSSQLFLLPFSNIGVFSFGISVEGTDDAIDLLDLNYKLRIFSKGKVQTIQSKRRDHPKSKNQEDKISQYLESQTELEQDDQNHRWHIGKFVNYMLSEIDNNIRTLSPARLQAFSFLEATSEINSEELYPFLFKLSRMYTDDYIPSQAQLKDTSWVSQTFKGIYQVSNLEGCCVLVESNQNLFYQNYKGIVLQRLLWTFLLAYIQRFSLISMAEDNSHLYKQEEEPSIELLESLVERISKVQLKCLFSEVSHISQQNAFYKLCHLQFRVDELFEEIKEEVVEINHLIADRIRERNEKSKQRNQRKIEILLFILIIPQIWLALLSTNVIQWEDWINQYSGFVGWVSFILWLGMLTVVLLMLRRR